MEVVMVGLLVVWKELNWVDLTGQQKDSSKVGMKAYLSVDLMAKLLVCSMVGTLDVLMVASKELLMARTVVASKVAMTAMRAVGSSDEAMVAWSVAKTVYL